VGVCCVVEEEKKKKEQKDKEEGGRRTGKKTRGWIKGKKEEIKEEESSLSLSLSLVQRKKQEAKRKWTHFFVILPFWFSCFIYIKARKEESKRKRYE